MPPALTSRCKKAGLAGLLALAGIFLFVRAGSTQQRSKPAHSVARATKVAAATYHDVSHRLRDLPPKPPRRGRDELEIREPRAPLRRAIRKPRALPDTTLQSAPAQANMPSLGGSFDGVSNVNGALPPDTNGAVGPNHYVQWVNLSFAIYDKSGDLLYGPADGNTLWQGFGGPCEMGNDGDPIVMHDDLADRWVMSQLALPNFLFGPFYQCVAVSETSDPTGAYHRYEFKISDTKLNDYPKLGVWPDGYYLAINQFDGITQAFVGQGVVAFEREKMLAGQPARMIYFDLFSTDPNLAAMLPSHVDGAAPPPGAPNIFVQFDDDAWGVAAQDQLQLWSFHVDWADTAASTFSGPTILTTSPFDSNLCDYARNCIPQPGTPRGLDSIPDRLMYRLQYRNFGAHESLVVNHTVDVGGDHAGIRWYEIRDPAGIPAIHQQGTYAPDADHRWMGSVALDGAGNMALGFSVASVGTFPSIRYAGRLAGDPPGTLAQGEAELHAGAGSQTHNTSRWGDYSSMSVDPNDHCTFWYTQEYYAAISSSNWRTRVGSFAFPSCPTGLPSVTIAATAQAAEAGPVDGAFTVSRTGSTAADLTVNYTVSGSAAPGSDYVALSGSVTIPEGATSAPIVVAPLDDTAFEPAETVVVTLIPSPAYTVGSPSSASLSITSDDVPSELVVSSLTAPATASSGATISVTDTTANQGAGPADASITRFFLSANTTFDAGDTPIGERAVPLLAPGANSSASTSVTLPAGIAGTHYILARADADNAVTESQEGNNVRSTSILIGADLVVTQLTGPSTAGAGAAILLTNTTKNQGGGAAAASITRFYLSTNALFDAGDVPMGERAIGALAPGALSSAQTSVTVPAGTAAGSYFVLAKADADGAVPETQEGNNLKALGLQVGPDLVVSILTAPATAAAGATITVTDTTKNQGGGAADASVTRFYLSTNGSLDSGDTPLAERAVAMLGPAATTSASTPVTIPSATVGGTYYILAKTDADSAIAETQEGNNVKSVFIQVGPDLAVSALTAPPSASPGAVVTVTDTTKNQGAGAADPSVTRFYLSTNTVFNAGDVLLGERSVPALAAGASHVIATSVTIPAGTAAGAYYLLAQADADNTVAETSETNNVKAAAIQIGPDLLLTAFTAPSAAAVGAIINVNDTTKNQGAAAADPSITRFYLSSNTALDAGDTPLNERSIPALNPGVSNSASTTLTIPPGTLPGTHYLLARADADNVVAETSETNNLKTSTIQVGPDLTVTTLTGPTAAAAGASITVTDATRNQGAGAAAPSSTHFYFSANTTLDAGDSLLAERSIPALASGVTSSGSTTVTLPLGLSPGAYYLLAKADGSSAVAEAQEGNNVKSLTIQVGPDLIVSALGAPSTAVAGATITVTDSTKNQGADAAGSSVTRFYLSANSLLDAADTPLGERPVPALDAGAISAGSTTVTIPAGTVPATYFLIAKTDADGAVGETQEGNNVKVFIIKVTAN